LEAHAGFGFGLGLLSLVPCALLLVLPAGVAGAARLTRRIELFETRRPR
jgi:CysZ protein